MKHRHGWAFPDADDLMMRELGADGRYQAAQLDAALTFVTDWSLAIDAGAHVGTWTRTLSGRFAEVIAVEPSHDTFAALTENMTAFGCQNVDARNIALGSAIGTVAMMMDQQAITVGNTGARFVRPDGPIRMESIDSWRLPTLGFLKLDIEGSEYAALCGARETLQRCRPVVLFESKNLWKRYGVPKDGPQDLLTLLGYRYAAKVIADEIWAPA